MATIIRTYSGEHLLSTRRYTPNEGQAKMGRTTRGVQPARNNQPAPPTRGVQPVNPRGSLPTPPVRGVQPARNNQPLQPTRMPASGGAGGGVSRSGKPKRPILSPNGTPTTKPTVRGGGGTGVASSPAHPATGAANAPSAAGAGALGSTAGNPRGASRPTSQPGNPLPLHQARPVHGSAGSGPQLGNSADGAGRGHRQGGGPSGGTGGGDPSGGTGAGSGYVMTTPPLGDPTKAARGTASGDKNSDLTEKNNGGGDFGDDDTKKYESANSSGGDFDSGGGNNWGKWDASHADDDSGGGSF